MNFTTLKLRRKLLTLLLIIRCDTKQFYNFQGPIKQLFGQSAI